MANEDLDLSQIDALPDPDAQPKPSAELDALATAIRTTGTGVNGDANGRTPDVVVADINAAANDVAGLATMMATVEECIRILKKAAAEWRKNAPKKAELDAAEKAVEDAKTAVAAAQKAEDEATSDAARAIASNAVNAANTSLQKAIRDLAALKAKRKAADEAYERERKKAVAKLTALTKGKVSDEAPATGTGTDTTSPGTGSGGTPAAAKPAGTPAGTPKPTGSTPAATAPSSTSPSSTTGKDSDLNTALAAAALAGQNQNQQPQQAAAATPQATPAATQPQQNQQDKKDDPNKKTTNAIDVDDLIREGALPASAAAATLTGVGGANPTTAAPAANGTTTTFRPASAAIPGTLPGGTPAPQPAPVVSGRSFDNLNTQSDVGGRPPGTENKPFAPGAPGTSTSGAHGAGNTAQSQAAAQQQAQRGAGMPMMPMVPPLGGAPAAGGGRSDGEAKPGVVRYEPGEIGRHGEDETSQAVRGGTIAQNRPERDTAA
ncbi:Uncharacterised protein [Mycobacteroides abscessus subsp. abscessus]|uniref:hypothetical protein n=1 Tax=Mycobacteroides abscessus TaxID=36809 RepID=UPI00092C0F51|nr:hypothetical protein [Mycobacteroides abscessus]SHP29033.1 Uncharacterised protein [Mycobacteroides abscessus subsp. abscessus]SHP69294.1 Uncharacterised protein [Mycobacteroides abscessus subsp. abscessus]SHY39496.1 Uncharacterised protein [Mycobacteroides abscessus subsp. abscessus]SKD93197.1 Uncharacterised protein [Mycobacteroides abscessus subsp. abscessus]